MKFLPHDIRRLKNAGYKIIECAPWHFQIQGHVLLNIWPSKRKYMVAYDNGASYYIDILKTVESIFGKPNEIKPKKTLFQKIKKEHENSISEEEYDAEFEWQEWRTKFAEEINSIYQNNILNVC